LKLIADKGRMQYAPTFWKSCKFCLFWFRQ